jgi:transcriptional regulator with XRE-family HTH domain
MNDPVTMRRKLRGELKRLRTEKGFTQRQVAEQFDWSQSKLIRIENGSVAIGVIDLRALLQLYGVVDGEVVAALEAMARGSKRQPFAAYRDTFGPETLRYWGYELSATIIRQVETVLVPGLLQTEEYARTLLEGWGFDRERIGKIWDARSERQELLDRADDWKAFFILDEAVVRRGVGGKTVIKRQLERLLELNSREEITIQILPFEAGSHIAMRGPFTYLEFAEPDDPDVLYMENPLGDSVFRDDPEITGQYLEDFFKLESIGSSKADLEKVIGQLDR